MNKIAKTFISLTLASTILAGSMASASAATFYDIKSSYNYKVTCTLQNKKKDGYVGIKISGNKLLYGRTQRNTVRMETTSGKYIWEEKGAIAMNGFREFRLGKNNKAYVIKVKTYYGTAGANFTNRGNVTISKKFK